MLRAGSQGRRYLSVRNGALALRDVKNEGRSGYVYENTGNDDKMASYKTGFCTKMHPLREDQQESVGLIGRKCASHAIIRGEVAPLAREPLVQRSDGRKSLDSSLEQRQAILVGANLDEETPSLVDNLAKVRRVLG
jgi:hypothetical protein